MASNRLRKIVDGAWLMAMALLATFSLAPAQHSAAVEMPICGDGRRVTCVDEGDTFWLNREKIRIANIDAPEMDARCRAELELAQRTTRSLVDLLSGVGLHIERQGLDRYGRTLATIRAGGSTLEIGWHSRC